MSEEEKIKQDVVVLNKQVGKLEGYNCNICKNKGLIYKSTVEEIWGQKHWEIKTVQCSCVHIREEIRRIHKSGLDNLIHKYTFKNYKTYEDWQHEVKTRAHAYANNIQGWFYIGGQPGSGKTHICTAIVGKIMSGEKAKAVKYMLWQDAITSLKQTINNNAELYRELMKQYSEAEVLYIDDFFKTVLGERVTTADINMTFKIINYRYNNNLPTIISSELSISEVCEQDQAVGSRIAELCGNFKLYIKPDTNKNYRFRK